MEAKDLSGSKPRVGVSACLLGQPVRYNGQGAADRWIIDVLSKSVELIPFCPEMAMGLGAPRDTLRLIQKSKDSTEPRLVSNVTGEDLTDRAQKASTQILNRVGELNGVILKKYSPSCGMERVRIYGTHGVPVSVGSGVFAERIRLAFPHAPAIEEGRLTDLAQKELFLTQVFSMFRLKQIPACLREIQKFHQEHKFLLLSHDPALSAELGQIAANSQRLDVHEVRRQYSEKFATAIRVNPTPGKRANALQHLLGFFKEALSPGEKEHALRLIEDYRFGLKPFAAALSLLENLTRRFSNHYVMNQVIFFPYPIQLNRS